MKRMRNQVLLPMDLEIKIAENDPVRKLVEICEELDYSKLYDQYVRTWRKYDPVVFPSEQVLTGVVTRKSEE